MVDSLFGAWMLSDDIHAGRVRLLAAPLSSWHRQSLALLGLTASHVTETASDLVHCEYLIVPSALNIAGIRKPSTLLAAYFRDLRRRCPRPDLPLPHLRRIYLRRGVHDRRTMRNEKALVAALEARGFVTVYPRELSIGQQLHLFAAAECVVGAHGSGMVNVAFMDPGAHVVEISPVLSNPSFWIARLCAVLGLRYAAIVVDVADEDRDETVAFGVARRYLEYRYDADIPAVLHALDVFGFR